LQFEKKFKWGQVINANLDNGIHPQANDLTNKNQQVELLNLSTRWNLKAKFDIEFLFLFLRNHRAMK
jgi:hypothetical protein